MLTEDQAQLIEQNKANAAADDEALRTFTVARMWLAGQDTADYAFFAHLAMHLEAVPYRNTQFVAVDGTKFFINPDWWNAQTRVTHNSVMIVAILHCTLQHTTRKSMRTPKRWDAACDLAAIDIMLEASMSIPAEMWDHQTFKVEREDIAEGYYEVLPEEEDMPSDGNLTEVAQGDATDPDKWRENVNAAIGVAKSKGDISEGVLRLVGEILEPKLPWTNLLQQFIDSLANNDYRSLPPNRRHIHNNIYAPSVESNSLGTIAVAIDTSGSVGDEELQQFGGELQGILMSYDCTVVLIWHDSKVCHTEVVTSPTFDFRPVGNGGTCHKPVFRWVNKHHPNVSCVVCLTDMYSEFGPEPDYPVIFVSCSKSGTHPEPGFGDVIEL